MVNKYLITTALEETWPKNKKNIIFLGEWCKLYSRKDYWKKFNGNVIEYHWNSNKKFKEDYNYLIDLRERLLVSISSDLNKLHGIDYSVSYWNILVGHWLGLYSQILFDRWEMMRKASDEIKDMHLICLDENPETITAYDTLNFEEQAKRDDRWNSYIYSEIANSFPSIKKIKIKPKSKFKNRYLELKKDTLKIILFKIYQKLISLIYQPNSPLIINTYLSLIDNFKLNFKFNLPSYYLNFYKAEYFNLNFNKRNWKINFTPENEFEKFLIKNLPMNIPTLFIEGYEKTKQNSLGLPWPKKPKFIFTSNSFYNDDLFKFYAAQKHELGSKLYIGQHGGGYGICKFNYYENYEINLSDKYFSWGWTNPRVSKIIPAGILTKIKINQNKKRDKLYLVTNANSRYSYGLHSASKSSQWLSYLEDQFKFVDNIDESIKPQLVVRLYTHDYKWNQYDRWLKNFPNLNYDHSNKTISKALVQSKIFISTYNSTTFLESIYFNIPTIIFWDPKIWEIRKSTEPLFEEFLEAGIFHTSPKSAALKVNSIWDNIDPWWNSKLVRSTISKFKLKYCNDLSLNQLKDLLEN